MTSIPVLVEAKKEYTNQLQQILSPRIYEGFKSIYEELINTLSQELYEKKEQSTSLIKLFQKSLRDIPLWNNEMVKNEYKRIEKISNCDYLENLIEAVFITNIKVLTAVQINSKKSVNVTVNVPQSQHFIHKCYIECSKEIYKNPYIFDISKNVTPKEKHNNLRETLNIINNSINNAIRNLLPIRDLLKQGLTNNNLNNDETEEEEDLNEKITFLKEGGNNQSIDDDNIKNKKDNESDNNEDEEDEENDEDDGNDDEDNEESEDKEEDESKNKKETQNEPELKEIILSNSNKELIKEQFKISEQNNDKEEVNQEDNQEETHEGTHEEEIEHKLSKLTQESYIVHDNVKDLIRPEIEEKKIIFLGKSSNSNPIKTIDSSIIKKEEILTGGNIELKNDKIDEQIKNIISNDTKKVELQNNPILKKLDIVEKMNLNSVSSINEIIKPLKNNFVKKVSNNKFMKQMPSSNKSSKSFYQKKYDENLANFNFTSENNNDNDEDIQNLQKKEKRFIDLNGSNSDNEESDIDFE